MVAITLRVSGLPPYLAWRASSKQLLPADLTKYRERKENNGFVVSPSPYPLSGRFDNCSISGAEAQVPVPRLRSSAHRTLSSYLDSYLHDKLDSYPDFTSPPKLLSSLSALADSSASSELLAILGAPSFATDWLVPPSAGAADFCRLHRGVQAHLLPALRLDNPLATATAHKIQRVGPEEVFNPLRHQILPC